MTPEQEYDARIAIEESRFEAVFFALNAMAESLVNGFRTTGQLALSNDFGLAEALARAGREAVDTIHEASIQDIAPRYEEVEAMALVMSEQMRDTTVSIARAQIEQDEVLAAVAANMAAALRNHAKPRAQVSLVNAVGQSMETVKAKLALLVGISTKTWWSKADGKVRFTHQMAHGQTVSILEPFIVGGYQMMYPQDWSAPPKETMHCRCICVYGGKW
jgi:hypothetical protein